MPFHNGGSHPADVLSPGHFGVTPVVVSGTVITRVPPLSHPLPVRAIFARICCVETRSGGPFAHAEENVLWEKAKVVWSSEDYAELGAWSHPFRISIPPEAARMGVSSQWLKEWRTVWRFEVVLEHKPIPYVGNRIVKGFFLNIRNHDLPPFPPRSPPSEITLGTDAYTTRVHITAPHGAYGPQDTLTLSFHAKSEDRTTAIKRATVVLERVVEFLEDNQLRFSASLFRRSTPPRPDDPSADAEICRGIVSTSSDSLTPGEGGHVWCSMNLEIPQRGFKWDVGETTMTKLVSVRYQLRLKLSVKLAKGRSRDFTCPGIPVHIASVSAAERAEARAVVVPTPTKRRHRSSRRGLYMQQGTVEISSPAASSHRRRAKSSSPLPTISGVATGLKPILLPPDHPGQAQSISFVFPSPPPHGLVRGDLPLISSIIDPSFPASPVSQSKDFLSPPGEYESWSIVKQFQQTGRRISTTASEEEAMQPSRNRQKVVDEDQTAVPRPSLPSLDALGLGLPHVAEYPGRRPMTAPASSVGYTNTASPPRPLTLARGSLGNSSVPTGSQFAFTLKEDD